MANSIASINKTGFFAGIVVFLLILFLPIGNLSFEAKAVLATAFMMGIWWITETIPIYITALIPLVMFPILSVGDVVKTSGSYVDRIIFLLLGGFFLASAIERCGLHKRFALHMIKIFGSRPKYVIGAFIIVTGSISAWMSNTATALLMMPIATALIASVNSKIKDRFAICLVLGIAYAASIGGLATLIGTPPNAIFASLAKSLVGMDVSFAKWMLVGLPISVISLFILWWYLVSAVRVGKEPLFEENDFVAKKLEELGKITVEEKIILAVFAVTVVAWITRGLFWSELLPMVDDSVIALAASLALFLISYKNKRMLDLKSASKIPWGILILVGGGLALAGGFVAVGLDTWIVSHLTFLVGLPYFAIIVVLLTIVVFLEFISNTATAALMIPIAASLARAMGIDPMLLMVPIAVGASFGFILPVSTPPNAIAVSSGFVKTKTMAKIGLPLNLITIISTAILTTLLVPLVWGQ
ncbi:SLC13 family permease [Candidatus Nitrosotenuis sp. DW1]|uniref:SLC13 family permease n=1 Tax=Candidatus Nitrosotenuis sp. DW1 TaxID=2259672 RepID=UPI0015CE3FA3|nr:SLC13 family permease [Candidatus Nitrosotenuis sp. DW1]